ncbi:glycerol-3-phosphate dehydrogenase/oxidase [Solimonas terrae]|uniref:Glycerol-3-phosphate dehydrogenase/oxidase n=1 Tax=Solimonas terrae TaxID=1396819 RepID=A0A6M2BQ15_9GAMM|nr:glycerol-3-phosphate dehydrogenase/oxidase [Solimonas terrae]NGY04305.1 glycerol-3-phosphate dehydrogenase/oxidase [Solimonas terrae]
MTTAFPLIRNTTGLAAREFDVLVVGGGIYGAWTAYDAASRGLSVALIEKTDWGSGTSSASSKLIHGGLRYLENYEFGLVRNALHERRTLYRIAPHLVRPLNFILPMWKGPRASPFLISAGLLVYDLLALGSRPVQSHRHYRARALLADYPFVDPQRLLGGFRYGDCQEDDARMTLAVVAAGQAAGVVCANRVAALRFIEQGDAVCGAEVQDQLTQALFAIRAKVVVNAAGPWGPALLGAAAPKVKLVKGTHLVLPAIPGCNEAFLLTANDGRVFFVIPWYGRTLVGTTESTVTAPAQAQPTDEETDYLLAGVRSGLPGLSWTRDDVIARYAGVRMLQAEDTASLSEVTREFAVRRPRAKLIMHIGGKYTTSRHDSMAIVDAVFRELGRRAPKSTTQTRPLPGAPPGNFETWQAQAIAGLAAQGVDLEAARWLSLRHGSDIAAISALIAAHPSLAARIHPEAPFVRAEAVHAVRAEMALSIDDLARRRMPLMLLVRDQQWRPALLETLAEFGHADIA